MKQLFPLAAALLGMISAAPAYAALTVGDSAPDFTVQAVQGQATVPTHLAELLKKGPVVLFFVPYVFNSGSAAECREFAASIDRFRAAGATVIGMSRDSTDALARFSTEDCGGKLAMAFADMELVTGYDVNDNANFATRTTYVIAPDGRIAFVRDDDGVAGHVGGALAFVEAMKK